MLIFCSGLFLIFHSYRFDAGMMLDISCSECHMGRSWQETERELREFQMTLHRINRAIGASAAARPMLLAGEVQIYARARAHTHTARERERERERERLRRMQMREGMRARLPVCACLCVSDRPRARPAVCA